MGAVLRQIWERESPEVWWVMSLMVCTYLVYLFKDEIRIYWTIIRLRGPPALPLLGNAHYVLDKDLLYKMSHDAYREYGGVFRFYLTVLPYVILLEPEDVQTVLGNTKHTQKIYFYRLLDNFLGKGLITSQVETWRTHRKILQPAFHLQVLQRYVTTFAECADRLANKFLTHDGKNIDITRLINDAVYEILNETILGLDVSKAATGQNGLKLEELPFRKGQVSVPYRLTHPWLLFNQIYRLTQAGKQEQQQSQDLNEACRKMIEVAKTSNRRDSILGYMLDLKERNPGLLTDDDIINECCTFMLAGQDSVGTATAMTLFLLANHPRWMERCVDEINELFESDPDRPPTYQDLKAMRNLEMCIKEALRLYPSVPLFARNLGEDIKVGKQVIPAGCGVIIIPYSTHRLPHHFPDPHEFRPERFTPENSEKRHPYAYLPFSAGPRNCIGNKFAILEIKAMISAILRKCQIDSVPGKSEVHPKFRLTVRAQGGLWVKITQRVDAQR